MKFSSARRYLSAALFLSLSIALGASAYAQQQQPEGINVTSANVYGVTTGNQLIRFNSSSPGTTTVVGTISGLAGGENVLGIDFRPATGELFAVTTANRLVLINKATAAASSPRPLSVALSGTSFGVDFNPMADRLRIVSNTGQNLRVDVSTGIATEDGMLNGAATGADAAGYTNSFSGAATTTLYDISSTTDTLYTQAPPNSGTLNAVGSLNVDATAINGFDILSADSSAFAALTVGGATGLYRVSLVNGSASFIGSIGNGTSPLTGFAIETAVTPNFIVYGLTTSNTLVRFSSSRPGTILSTVTVTGLQSGENLLGIDFRPATGQLFALGSGNRLYTLNPVTGAATQVGNTGGFTLSGTDFGFDFNPQPDRIRVVSNTGQNIRINPNDGTLVPPGDTNLSPGTPQVSGAAYTNSFPGTATTTLYDIDYGSDTLVIQGGLNSNPSPNGGVLTPVGPLGVNATANVGFDIAGGNNTALAALQDQTAASSSLYSINLSTGAATIIGPIGSGLVIRDIAIARGSGSSASTVLDFDGDGRTDETLFRLSNNTWFIRFSSDNTVRTQPWGQAGDFFVPGDYDGDGKTDIAVWRPSNGTFFIINSSNNSITTRQFGIAGDEPVARDYDGDGRTDYAVVRRSGGVMTWFVQQTSNGGFRQQPFGVESDIVAPGDYDGDGRFDLGVRRGTGSEPAVFYTLQTIGGYVVYPPFGFGFDLVVPGDYDGDGKTDLTALRQGSTYTWFFRTSSGSFFSSQLGRKPDYAAQGDYDGDGKTDIAIYDPIFGAFRYFQSSNLALIQKGFGMNGDVPVASYDTH